jgi:HEAT repeat protein
LNAVAAPEVVPVLTFATNDPEPSVRSTAIGYLATRLGSDATQALVDRAAVPDTRDRALEALAVAADQRVEHLLALFESADEDRATLVAEILVRLRRPSAHAALAQALVSPNVAARRAAAAALVDLATPEARRALEAAAARDPDEAVRRIATVATSA